MIRINSQKGFTLIELMVAASVTGVLIVVIMAFFASSIVSTSVESARADLLKDAQLGLDIMGRDIRLSASAEQNNRWPDEHAPNAPTDPLSWESTDQTLILATSAMDNNNDMLFQDALQYVTYKNNVIYFIRDNTLYRRVLAADIDENAAKTSCPDSAASESCPADRKVMENVESFAIRYVNGNDEEVAAEDARSVEVTVALKTTRYRRDVAADYTTRMVFRNE